MANIVRELKEKGVRGIRRLVVERCANYHEDYGCLPLDCECVMFGKAFCGNAMCKYFRESVLPNDPELSASLQNLAAKRCKVLRRLRGSQRRRKAERKGFYSDSAVQCWPEGDISC